ncbi:MAG: orotidine-5'-phosphate decarboxylase [Candidatus Kaiserbacteria bacterium]|nr:orotidine-5'-phosphate decarboxylase [Candidatus Kaiserbacteria bacterium]
MTQNFMEMLQTSWAGGRFTCVGLDSEYPKIPACIRSKHSSKKGAIVEFNKEIVRATWRSASAYKPNLAFFLAIGAEGLEALIEVIQFIHESVPGTPVILDTKDMDIGNTNLGYIQFTFEECNADAVTVNPYLGMEAAQPYLDQKDKGVIVLSRTSNPGAGEFQDLSVHVPTEAFRHIQDVGAVPWSSSGLTTLYNYVAYRVAHFWNKNGNCGLVVGATAPAELESVRKIVGTLPILIPGVGAQGGDVEATVKAGKDSNSQGFVINASRSIIFASSGEDFAEAAGKEAQRLNDEIISHLN